MKKKTIILLTILISSPSLLFSMTDSLEFGEYAVGFKVKEYKDDTRNQRSIN